MGQFGALGYALRGWSYEQILDHYYGGTRMAAMPPGDVTVQLTRFDGFDVIVAQEKGHLHTSAAAGVFSALRARRTGFNRFSVDAGGDCGGGAGGWQEIAR